MARTKQHRICLKPSQLQPVLIYRPFKDGGLSKPRPKVQRATGSQLLCDHLRPVRLEPRPSDRKLSTLTTRLSDVCGLWCSCMPSVYCHWSQRTTMRRWPCGSRWLNLLNIPTLTSINPGRLPLRYVPCSRAWTDDDDGLICSRHMALCKCVFNRVIE